MILADLGNKIEDLGKNVIDPSKFWQENKQILIEKFMG